MDILICAIIICVIIILCFNRKSVEKFLDETLDEREIELKKRNEACLKKYIKHGIMNEEKVQELEKLGIDPTVEGHARAGKRFKELIANIDKILR